MTLRLLTYNIRRGGTGREGPIGDVIGANEPDVVIVQEATAPAVIEKVAVRAGMEWASTPGESLGFTP